MINFKHENIFKTQTEAIINTVNLVGVMGKGIALQFKEKYPENFKAYKKACENKQIDIGKIFVTNTEQMYNPKYIINFPTKNHWKNPSKIEYIKDGLKDLKKFLIENNIKSVAIPPLGAGNGGLDWKDVKSLIENELKELTDIEIIILEPSESFYEKDTSLKTAKLTEARAMMLKLFHQYTILGYELTLLEAQKLVYFLQRFGENLKLDYSKNFYGPYAHNLNHVLHILDGHFLNGLKYKDAKPFDNLFIKEERLPEIENFINNNCSKIQKERLEKVSNLIEGFESPLGMELLATVDFILTNYPETYNNKNNLISKIHEWSERKKELMKPEYILTSYKRLNEYKFYLYSNIKSNIKELE